jgi:hypothetical protein
MTVSKCLQLVLYGLIVGYEIPRMEAKFSALKQPKIILNSQDMPVLQCNPGKELETINT